MRNQKLVAGLAIGIVCVAAILVCVRTALAATPSDNEQRILTLERTVADLEARVRRLEGMRKAHPLPAGVTPNPRYTRVGAGHVVDKIMDGGAIVILEDNSFWQVNEPDRRTTAKWKKGDKLKVLKKPGLRRAHALIHEMTGTTATADYVGGSSGPQ